MTFTAWLTGIAIIVAFAPIYLAGSAAIHRLEYHRWPTTSSDMGDAIATFTGYLIGTALIAAAVYTLPLMVYHLVH